MKGKNVDTNRSFGGTDSVNQSEAVPKSLAERGRWLPYQLESSEDDYQAIPFSVKEGTIVEASREHAGTYQQATEVAREYSLDGIGFLLEGNWPTQVDIVPAPDQQLLIPADELSEEKAVEEYLTAMTEWAVEERDLDPEQIGEKDDRPVSVRNALKQTKTIRNAVIKYRRYSNDHSIADTRGVLADIIYRDLTDCGKIISPRNEAEYYFYRPERRVYQVHSSEFRGLLEERYDLQEDREGKVVVKRIERRSSRIENQVEIQRIGYWDDGTDTLCLHDHDGGYYAIQPDGIKHRANGENGIFFLPADNQQKITYLPPDERVSIDDDEIVGERDDADSFIEPYRRLLVNRANVSDHGLLSKDQPRMLLDVYLHALPFMNRIPEKPILTLTGPKESGKTAIIRCFGQLLVGPRWDVTQTADEDDFWAAATHSPIVGYDQMDQTPSWLPDALASVATGTTYQKRRLYTTNEMVEYRPMCWLLLGSRTPKFTRTDVSSRLIVLNLEGVDKKWGRRRFMEPIENYYSTLMSQYIDQLQRIVTILTQNSDPEPSSFRMADWAEVVKEAGPVLGYSTSAVTDVINLLDNRQAAFAMRDSDTYTVLQEMKSCEELEAEYLARELHEELSEFALEEGLDYPLNGPRPLGNWLNSHESDLEALLGLEITDADDSKENNLYQFP